MTLGPRERLVLFTNGLPEARSGNQTLGLTGVAEILRTSQRRDCRGLAQELYEGAYRFAGGALKDDVAVLVVALNGRDGRSCFTDQAAARS